MQPRDRGRTLQRSLALVAAWSLIASACIVLPAHAAPRRLLLQGDDWVCTYSPFRTPLAGQLLVDVCGTARELYDWRGGFVPVAPDVRALSPDGRWAVGSEARFDDTQVFLYDRQAGTTTRVTTTELGLPSSGRNSGALVSADGARVIFTSFALDLLPAGSGSVAVLEWRRADGGLSLRAPGAQLLAASADGEVIAVHEVDLDEPYFALLDRSTGQRETLCVAGASVCEFLGLSPDGRWLAYAHAASGEPAARVLRDRASGQEWALPGFQRGRGSVAFDPGSAQVAYDAPSDGGGGEHALRVRVLASGEERPVHFDRPLSWHVAPVAFGPDRQLAVYDGTTVIVPLDTVFASGVE